MVDDVNEKVGSKYIPWLDRRKNLLGVWTGIGAVVGVFAALGNNLIQRRPFFAGIQYYPLSAFLFGTLGFSLGSLRKYNLKYRDAVIDHYVELHPEDFKDLNLGRKYKEILFPWNPVRADQSSFEYLSRKLKAVEERVSEEMAPIHVPGKSVS